MAYFPPVGGGVILPNSIDNTILADMAAGTVKGRAVGAGTGDPQDMTGTQVQDVINSSNVNAIFGTLQVQANVTADGMFVAAAGQYTSANSAVELAATGAGTVHLRPNGAGNTTGQTGVFSSGRLEVAGDIYANDAIWAHKPSSGRDFGLQISAGTHNLSFSANWYLNWNPGNGNLQWTRNSAVGVVFFADGMLHNYGSAAKPGGGVWSDTSDVRIKDVHGEYKRGVAEVMALQPRVFSYKGNDTIEDPKGEQPGQSLHRDVIDQHYVGLIAQEAELVMPEMVTRRSGYIDGIAVDDMRIMDTTPLIFALVNAVRELKAEIDALKAGI